MYGIPCLDPPMHSAFDINILDILVQEMYWCLEEWMDIKFVL